MLCVHNTDKPYYCEKCEGFFKVKTEYEEHAAKDHPDDLPDDLVQEPVARIGGEVNCMQDIQIVEVVPSEEWGVMPLQKMRTLLALLLKKISTPGAVTARPYITFSSKTNNYFRSPEEAWLWNPPH